MLKKYLFSSFAQIFFPFFLVLFFIASVVLLIDIAGNLVKQITIKACLSLISHRVKPILPRPKR